MYFKTSKHRMLTHNTQIIFLFT